MPYINREAKLEMKHGRTADSAGELNYAITLLLKQYIDKHGLSYRNIADCLSACDGASKEFYRRVAAPYEDTKIATNGDVYQ